MAYDGAAPRNAVLAEQLFGTSDLSLADRSVVVAVCGARGGKSYVLVALRLVWGMYVRDLSPVRPGQRAAALIVAPNEDLRREVVNYAIGAVQAKPELRATLHGEPATDAFKVRRPDGHVVEFKAGVATRGGYGGRGRWWTDAALDESAFFRDKSSKINDVDIYQAASARVLPGGQTIVPSTPWAETGLLYDLFQANWGKRHDTALAVHAPTLLLYDSETNRRIVERERARDPDNARREYDAEFMTSGTSVFFEPSLLDAATVEEPFAVEPGDIIAAGADFGFRSDSSSLMLVALRGETLHVFDARELRPEPGRPLKPSRTVAEFAQAIAGRCGYVMADQHYRETIAEQLEAHNLTYTPAPIKPADTYVRARVLLREGRVRLHPVAGRDRLLRQMREVHGKPTSAGGMSIIHPSWATGGHGDLCAALMLALWQVSGDEVPEVQPTPGTMAHEEQLREQRRQEWVRDNAEGSTRDRGRRAWWKRTG